MMIFHSWRIYMFGCLFFFLGVYDTCTLCSDSQMFVCKRIVHIYAKQQSWKRTMNGHIVHFLLNTLQWICAYENGIMYKHSNDVQGGFIRIFAQLTARVIDTLLSRELNV